MGNFLKTNWKIGSSDAIALAHHGTRCPVTAALHIILGDRRNVDVMKINSLVNEKVGKAFCSSSDAFSLAMASYGYFGDLLQRSEKIR